MRHYKIMISECVISIYFVMRNCFQDREGTLRLKELLKKSMKCSETKRKVYHEVNKQTTSANENHVIQK